MKRTRWATLLSAAFTGTVAAGFLAMTTMPLAMVTVPLVLAAAVAAWYSMRRLRPKTTGSFWAPVVLVIVGALSAAGSESLWFTAFGELEECGVTSVRTETPRRSPSYRYNELDCGASKISHYLVGGHGHEQVGARVDLVLDRTGFARYAEPTDISPLRNSLVGLSVLVAIVFIVLVLRWPRRKPRPQASRPRRHIDGNFI